MKKSERNQMKEIRPGQKKAERNKYEKNIMES